MSKFAGSLDTNIVLRLILGDVPSHRAKAKKLLDSTTQQFAVADTVLIEAAFVMERAYGLSRMQIVELLEGFMGLKQVNCNQLMLDKALALYIKNSSLSLEDCALAVYAELNRAIPLYTFDAKLAKSTPSAKLL